MSAFIKKIFSPLVMLNCLGMILDLVEEAGVADTIRAIDDHHHSGAA